MSQDDQGRNDVHIGTILALVASVTVMAAGPTLAAFWDCPEIDGPAGVSAIATLISAAIIAHHRLPQ